MHKEKNHVNTECITLHGDHFAYSVCLKIILLQLVRVTCYMIHFSYLSFQISVLFLQHERLFCVCLANCMQRQKTIGNHCKNTLHLQYEWIFLREHAHGVELQCVFHTCRGTYRDWSSLYIMYLEGQSLQPS